MRSPNAVLGKNNENKEDGAEKQAEKSGWDEVAAEADKKDWATQSVENEYNDLTASREKIRAKIDELYRQKEEQAKKPDETFYDYSSGDVRTYNGGHGERLDKQIDELSSQLAETDIRYGQLSSESKRESLAQEKRREAAVKEEMEKMQREEMSKAAAEVINAKYDLSPEEKKRKMMERIDSVSEEFAEGIGDISFSRMTSKEALKVKNLKKEYDDYINSNKHGFFDKGKHNKNVKELERYGFNPDGSKSSDFRKLERFSEYDPLDDMDRKDFSKERAEDWRKLSLYMARGDEREIKKALKKAGYNKVPEKWNDEDYTTHEIKEMYRIAKSEIESEEAK